MITVYSDSQIINLEWIPNLKFPHPYIVCHNINEYEKATTPYKIAVTAHRLNCDLDPNGVAYQGFEEKIIRLSECSNLVFTLESELHNYHWTIWEQCHRPNVYWVQPGAVNDRDDMNANIIYWGDWFKTTVLLYQALPDLVAQFKPYEIKPKSFDALLGSPKPHRDFVAQAVQQHNLQDQVVVSYGGSWHDTEFYAKDYFIWEPECVPEGPIIGTADYVRYHGELCHLSQVIPMSLFNDTAYSIIAETDHDNTLSFFSEKTAKPMIARRLFVAFTGYKFLSNLRQLGFQTFDGIINESYDLIKDDQARYAAAFEQVRYLCGHPQAEILERIRPIVEHNYNMLMNTNWTRYATDRVQQKINLLF